MYCKNCGNEISDLAFVCPKCGVKVKDDPVYATAPAGGGAGAASSSSSSASSVTVNIDGNKSGDKGLFFPIATLLCYIFLYPIGFILNIVGLFSGEKKGCFLSMFFTFFVLPLIAFLLFILYAAIAEA